MQQDTTKDCELAALLRGGPQAMDSNSRHKTVRPKSPAPAPAPQTQGPQMRDLNYAALGEGRREDQRKHAERRMDTATGCGAEGLSALKTQPQSRLAAVLRLNHACSATAPLKGRGPTIRVEVTEKDLKNLRVLK